MLASHQKIDNQLYQKFLGILENKIRDFGVGKLNQRVDQLQQMNEYVKLKCDIEEVEQGVITSFKARYTNCQQNNRKWSRRFKG